MAADSSRPPCAPSKAASRSRAFYAGIVGVALNVTILERMVNGQPGLVAQLDGVVTVFAFGIAGDRIKHIWAVRTLRSSGPGR